MATRGRVLIVDNDAAVRSALLTLLRAEGYDVGSVPDPIRARRRLSELAPEVVITDARLPGMDGLCFMERVREAHPETVVLVTTEAASVGGAVEAIKRGADDYLEKPLRPAGVIAAVERALRGARLLDRTRSSRGRADASGALDRIVGDHASVREVRELIARVAPTSVTVLVSGETGTGKELVAEALHEQSGRAGPLVKLSCAVLAESVLESELFGHERGAFTGALARREGRFKQADGGTLYLDEMSEIPASTQVKLLRVLQERAFERVGGNETLRVDVRLVASTNRDLRRAVDAGTFREDLFYRLDVVRVDVPPLRARRMDVPLLATSFVERYARLHQKAVDSVSAEALERLAAYAWPGNVRELENVIERAVVMAGTHTIGVEHLPHALGARVEGSRMVTVPGSTLAEVERETILKSLAAVGGSTSRAAAMLQISPRKIQYRLREYGVRGASRRDAGARDPAD